MAQTIRLKRSAVAGRIPSVNDLDLGEVAINTTDGKMYIKKSSGGTESVVEIGSGGVTASFTLYEYTASASQTTFTGSDDNSNTLAYDTGVPPKIQVFLNGVLLDYVTDYTATNGTSVVLVSAAAADDLVQVAAYKSVTVDSDIALGDNTKILLGNDGDLELFHNGSNSIINQTGTGNLLLQKDETTVATVSASGVDVTGDVTANSFILDTSATIDPLAQGQLAWDSDNGTAHLGLSSTISVDIGEQTYFQVKAAQALSAGDVVYASGAVGNSGKIEVSKFISNNTIEERFVLGIAAESISTGEYGYVLSLGALRGLSTNGSDLTTPETWVTGTVLYASPTVAGELTSTKPTAPNQAIAIAFVTSAHASNGSLAVRAYDLGYHLEELHDVYVNSAADNDILQWSTANSRWENVAGTTSNIAEGTNLYYTTARANTDFDTRLATKSTTNLSEGTNLYFTDARAVSAVATADDYVLNTGDTMTGALTVPQLNVDTVASIDTLTSTTTSTTGVAIDAFAAATYRSARYTVQATNSTDSTYHITELLVIHDGTTAHATEYGTIFTGAAAEAAYEVDISSGNVRLIATPASSDSITFKVVRHSITV